MSDPEAEPAAPAVKVYAMTVRVVEYMLLKSRSVGPRTPVQTACSHKKIMNMQLLENGISQLNVSLP